MASKDWKLEILARRATFCAMAVAGGAAGGCDKDETHVVPPSPSPSATPPPASSDPQPCLRPILGPAASTTIELGQKVPFVLKRGGEEAVRGTVLAKVEGPDIPHAATIATGAHLRNRTRACFLDAAGSGGVKGTLMLVLEVGPDGSVTKASAAGSIAKELRSCVATKAEKLGFHPPDGNEPSKVIVEMEFPGAR